MPKDGDSVLVMTTLYTAQAIKIWGPDSGSSIPESVDSHYVTPSKLQAINWCMDVVRNHGWDGDCTVDRVQCWNDNPDDAWRISVFADAEGLKKIEIAESEMFLA